MRYAVLLSALIVFSPWASQAESDRSSVFRQFAEERVQLNREIDRAVTAVTKSETELRAMSVAELIQYADATATTLTQIATRATQTLLDLSRRVNDEIEATKGVKETTFAQCRPADRPTDASCVDEVQALSQHQHDLSAFGDFLWKLPFGIQEKEAALARRVALEIATRTLQNELAQLQKEKKISALETPVVVSDVPSLQERYFDRFFGFPSSRYDAKRMTGMIRSVQLRFVVKRDGNVTAKTLDVQFRTFISSLSEVRMLHESPQPRGYGFGLLISRGTMRDVILNDGRLNYYGFSTKRMNETPVMSKNYIYALYHALGPND